MGVKVIQTDKPVRSSDDYERTAFERRGFINVQMFACYNDFDEIFGSNDSNKMFRLNSFSAD